MSKDELELAVQQVMETIRRHLLTCPPGGVPVQGLTEDMIANLARHIVMLREGYGKPREVRFVGREYSKPELEQMIRDEFNKK